MINVKEAVGPGDVVSARSALKDVIRQTPLEYDALLSDRHQCQLYLKREDLQVVRSFKLRGAYHFLSRRSRDELDRGVVCASAGNHAQGVAYSCRMLQVQGKIFMPTTTPNQKVNQVARFGGPYVEIVLTGDTFDASFAEAMRVCERERKLFVHPFDDPDVIAGQGTVGLEIIEQFPGSIDYLFVGIGGGGLAAGLGTYLKKVSPMTKIIGVEPAGAPAMHASLCQNERVMLRELDKFVDGAAVQQVGTLTLEICKQVLDDVVLVPEGKVCSTILQLYNENAIVVEPAGALALAALDFYRNELKGKNVVCVISGGNNDIDRMSEIKERSLIYEGLKHYFIINFPQRAGALREFINGTLTEQADITRFEYIKKNNRDSGPALVGIELKERDEYPLLIERMEQNQVDYMEINKDPNLFHLLI
ncbi:threonine ammonia-lyase IlvA [Laceyella sacchari]|jgi:threonine dehydratase|uniref:L-threonine dehydratase n=1 Tax=Laceyella sacchari TaxID=37482 RepID=A0ABY5U368_LACSH|nr:threonine ammonia-lyase IlvA [Laceyella sacchari]TCW34837.1 L-threonine ammonia-lyase [Laceyella sacchari]UWE02523.1 threonine ammonia-lyase IlvA [Laceyella sacchari]